MTEETNKTIFPATVVEKRDDYTVVINRGAKHGVKQDSRFLIYSLSPKEIIDPETSQSLGFLEIVKGIGKVIHVQELMATLESAKNAAPTRKIIKTPPKSVFDFAYGIQTEEIIESAQPVPFDNAGVGDKAKPI